MFYCKMDPLIQMRITHVKYRYAIHLKFGDKFFTSISKLVLYRKASICSVIKEILHLYCKSAAFVITVLIKHILIARSLSEEKRRMQ